MKQAELFPDWREKVIFSPEGPQPQVLIGDERIKVVIAGLESGQRIPPHPEGAAIYHFLTGSGWMLVDDARWPVTEGATVVMPAGTVRGVEAETRLAFMATRIAGN